MKAASKIDRTESVSAKYVHFDKFAEPDELLELSNTTLKWYNLSQKEEPVPAEIRDLARGFLERESSEGKHEQLGDVGFVILHRCGRDFYFLLVSTWRNENELWETVYAKKSEADTDFSLFPLAGPHRATFCVWELAAVWHEQQSWRRYLLSDRDVEARRAYIQDRYRGVA